jgi:FKBP-type peptidyl-prolyl cis-trans isomerase
MSLLALLTPIWGVQANNSDIPAILQFAEKYDNAELPGRPAEQNQEKGQKQEKKPRHQAANTLLSQLAQKESLLEKQKLEIEGNRKTISSLQQRLAALEKEPAAQPAPLASPTEKDVPGVRALFKTLRQSMGITPQERAAIDKIKQAKELSRENQLILSRNQDMAQKMANLEAQLKAERQTSQQEVQRANGVLTTQLKTAAQDIEALKSTLSESRKREQQRETERTEMTGQLQVALEEKKSLEQKLGEAVQEKNKIITEYDEKLLGFQNRGGTDDGTTVKPVTAESLKKVETNRGYASGVSVGEEIMALQSQKKLLGLKNDQEALLRGVIDTLAGKRMMDDNQVIASLASAQSEMNSAQDKISQEQGKIGKAYTAKFAQEKGTKKSPSGFLYRIDYAGDAPIPDDASVDVVVKETLTDGSVIQDMEAHGTLLSQPVESFPPVFREAIKLLKNHGSITFVVPPESAYGQHGLAPKVPPNATMVYTLRIVEMYPQGMKNGAKK